jgi:C-terminal processing protease CtpA/Prc
MMCITTVTHAQEETANATSLDDAGVLDRLNDDDFRVRQAETRRLLSDEALTQGDLNHLYSSSSTLEQRHRLLLIARHHMISRLMQERLGDQAGPGSMGLSHQVVQVTVPGEASPRTGVLVVMTLPGFPAYALLEPGDIIVDFAGEPIPQNMTPTQFQQTIKTFQNGQSVGLVVVRDGAAEHILFRLGPGQGLGEVYDTGGVTLKEPYETSWATLRTEMRALVGEHDAVEPEGITADPVTPTND